jgi:hypothetical protein
MLFYINLDGWNAILISRCNPVRIVVYRVVRSLLNVFLQSVIGLDGHNIRKLAGPIGPAVND